MRRRTRWQALLSLENLQGEMWFGKSFEFPGSGLKHADFFTIRCDGCEILQVLGVCGQTAQNWQVTKSCSQARFLMLLDLVPLIPHF